MATLAWFHIELTAKVLGVFARSARCSALLVFWRRHLRPGGGADGFRPRRSTRPNIFDNPAAIEVFGAGAAGIALFGAFWSWVGFEMAPNYAEESRDPKQIAKMATYGSVIGLGVLYIVHARTASSPAGA